MEDMVIRKLKPEEHFSTRHLYETVFSEDDARFVDYYYQYRAEENEIYAAEDDTGIHAMLHVNPCRVFWNNRPCTLPYIVAVATEENFRRRGLMGRLLTKALEDMRRDGIPFAFLMPAAEAIYTPYGFRRAWPWRWEEQEVCQSGNSEGTFVEPLESAGGAQRTLNNAAKKVNESIFMEAFGNALTIRERRPASDCSREELEALSQRVNRALAGRYSLFSERSPEYYRRLQQEQQASGGTLEILFDAEGPLCARCSAREEFPPMMARILHPETFFAGVRCHQEKELLWEIRDALLPENSGVYRIRLGTQGGVIQPASPDCGETPLCLDISQVPEALGDANPFRNAMVCEVV